MKAHSIILYATFICLFCIYSCDSKKSEGQQNSKANEESVKQIDQKKTIIFYGSNTCHHCTDFKAKLDSIGLTYTFKDVYAVNENNDAEMLDKIQQAGYMGYVRLPVIDIEGKIMVRPDLEQVMKEMDI